MGILNITPDSFSKDGLLKSKNEKLKRENLNHIINYANHMIKDGADILDIGGESSRPGAKPVPAKEEIQRVIPVIKRLSKKIKIPISIDTYKAEVAEAALDSGAAIVNDISALSDREMTRIIKKYKAAVILMHMRGNPANMQDNLCYNSLIPEIILYLRKKIKIAVDSGIEPGKIIIDPGLGFGKSAAQNVEIINRLGEFNVLKMPILIGPSRKSFIGKILNKGERERAFGTAAAVCLAIANGAHIARVHDVAALKDAAKVADAILNERIIN